MLRMLRRTASVLLLTSSLLVAVARPAWALGRMGRPGHDGPSLPAAGPVERGSFLTFLLHLFGLSRGTMDPNGGS